MRLYMYGDESLPYETNQVIFEAVYKYIPDSKIYKHLPVGKISII